MKNSLTTFVFVLVIAVFLVTFVSVQNTTGKNLAAIQTTIKELRMQMGSLQEAVQLLLSGKSKSAQPAQPAEPKSLTPESMCPSGEIWCGEMYCSCSTLGNIVYIFERHPGKGPPAQPAQPAVPASEESTIYFDCFGEIACSETYCGCISLGAVRSILYLPRSLRRGDTGDDVRRLQNFLKQWPEIYPEGYVTGYYGPATESAIRRLEKQCNLTPSGKVAPKLVVILNELTVYETLEICGTLRIQPAGKSPLNR